MFSKVENSVSKTFKFEMVFSLILGFVFLKYTADASKNPITLQNGNHITCIYPDIASTIYLNPPMEQSENKSPFFLNEIWDSDDWNAAVAKKSPQAPVTDRRWEDFNVIETKYYRFTIGNSIAFSVYTSESIKFYLGRNKKLKHFELPENKQYLQWNHYHIISINNKVFFMENGHIIRKIEDMRVDHIAVRSNKKFYLKPHDYSFKVSKIITKEKPSQFTIKPTGKGKSCFLLYYSVCKECYLELEISNGKNVSRKTFNYRNELWPLVKPWEQSPVEIDTDNESQIRIFRRHAQGEENGYWALDIRSCPDVENNMGIYKVEAFGAPVERTCHILGNLFEENNQLDNITVKSTTAICSEPGKLGNDCSISCGRILGDNFSFCEQHRICESSNCTCSWGYQGTFCQERCPKGTWGLSCQKSCQNSCEMCDGKTGKCLKKSTASIDSPNMDPAIKIVIIVIIILIMVGGLSCCYWANRRRKRSRKYRVCPTSDNNRQSCVASISYQSSQILIHDQT